jgi:hypothetical protein
MELSGEIHVPATLLPGKGHLVSNEKEAIWTLEPVSTIRKIRFNLTLAENGTPVVHPVACSTSIYTLSCSLSRIILIYSIPLAI